MLHPDKQWWAGHNDIHGADDIRLHENNILLPHNDWISIIQICVRPFETSRSFAF